MPKYVTIDGVDYEVVWDGGEGLVPDRVTKDTGFWEAAPRMYNRTGKYKGLFNRNKVKQDEPKIEDIREE